MEAIAVGLLAQAGKDRRVLFQTAWACLASSGQEPLRCRNQAFKVLNELIDQGWKDNVSLKTDPDLESVRGDKRFSELLVRLPVHNDRVASLGFPDVGCISHRPHANERMRLSTQKHEVREPSATEPSNIQPTSLSSLDARAIAHDQ